MTKLTAVCTVCGDDASFTRRLGDAQETELIGADDMYTSCCRTCFFLTRDEFDAVSKCARSGGRGGVAEGSGLTHAYARRRRRRRKLASRMGSEVEFGHAFSRLECVSSPFAANAVGAH